MGIVDLGNSLASAPLSLAVVLPLPVSSKVSIIVATPELYDCPCVGLYLSQESRTVPNCVKGYCV